MEDTAAQLPKLEIPVFTGEPLKWQPFWDCFEAAINANSSLTGVQKLSYLCAQLKGEASRVIAGLALTNLNYHHSLSLLRDRHGQPHTIINPHIQALLELSKPTNKLGSPEQLETLLVPMALAKFLEETKCRRTTPTANGQQKSS